MNDLRNIKIDRIERRLLKANSIPLEELREIVSAPQLFDKINDRIKTEQAENKSEAGFAKPAIFPVWGWPKVGIAFGGLAFFLAGALGLIFFTRQNPSLSQLTDSVAAPEIKPIVAFVENPEPRISEIGKMENPVDRSQNKPEKIAFKNKASKFGGRVSGMNSTKRLPRPSRNETEQVFYPLVFSENLDEAKEAGQVIRVELSRSSMLALGLNPPSDDENLKVKTDLLIGSDGIARGFRFVK